MITIAVIGLGSRGTNYMRWLKLFNRRRAKIVAICDKTPLKVEEVGKQYKLPADACFTDEAEFFKEKRADAVWICTQDNDHYRNCMQALAVGYDIMVEKPLSFNVDECMEIERVSREKGLKVVVCHVLRYSNYYGKIKELLRSGELGDIVTINHEENIANFHYAHSYVRGNWHKLSSATPILMAKCCHDIDLISWFMEGEAEKVVSYGALTYFKEENAPAGAPARCSDGCPAAKTCPYNAVNLYIKDPFYKAKWIKYMRRVLTDKNMATKKDLWTAMKDGPYGKCVFKCDNDVFDHQNVLMEFSGGRIACHTLSAFTYKMFRRTHITCTKGEIFGDDLKGKLTVSVFSGNKTKKIRTSLIKLPGHIEGDIHLVRAFISLMDGTLKNTDDVTFVSATIPSHRTIARAEAQLRECALTKK